MTQHETYYAAHATPNLSGELIADLAQHLRLNGIKPDVELIKRILWRRGVCDEIDLMDAYGRVLPFAGFATEYNSEVVKQ